MGKPVHPKTRERILALLAEQGPMSTQEIADRFDLRATVAGAIVSAMVRTHLILRIPPEAGQFSRYCLFPESDGQQSEEVRKAPGKRNASEACYRDRFWDAFLRKTEIPKP